MANAHGHASDDHVNIELVDAGGQKDRVVMVLSKVNGLTMPAEHLVQHIPCTIATDVPRSLAEKLKNYLEKAGAMVMLEEGRAEDEEELFAADEFPLDSPAANEHADDLLAFEPPPLPGSDDMPEIETDGDSDELTFTADDVSSASADDEMPQPPAMPDDDALELDAAPAGKPSKGGVLGNLLSKLPAFGKKQAEPRDASAMLDEQGQADTPIDDASSRDDAGEPAPKKSPFAFLSKLRPSKPPSAEHADDAEGLPEAAAPDEPAPTKRADFFSSPVAYVLIGLLAGAILAGGWGWMGIQRQRQELLDYEVETAQQIEEHSAQLKNMVAELSQNVETLQQENATLGAQNADLAAELDAARQQGGAAGAMPANAEAVVAAFLPMMEEDARLLEESTARQQQAGCSRQILLDGNGTLAYAQVVKQFSARYTRYDIRRSDSLFTPYTAELKIPFQQQIRTGDTPEACDAAALHTLDTPPHHEFGGYYGYWTLEYAYRDGQWTLHTTVVERNRALYESAFQKGSPDYAKFSIDPDVFPDLAQ